MSVNFVDVDLDNSKKNIVYLAWHVSATAVDVSSTFLTWTLTAEKEYTYPTWQVPATVAEIPSQPM